MAARKKAVENAISETAEMVEKQAKEVKAAVEEAEAKVEAVMEPAKKKVEEAIKKAEPAVKKAATKTKETAKKAARAVKPAKAQVFVQFAGREISADKIVEAAKADYRKKTGAKVSEIKTVDVYVKPEENAAYYVVNGEGKADYRVEL